jgi:hypothetical protein
MEESKEDAELRKELIASIQHSLDIINKSIERSKEYDEEL